MRKRLETLTPRDVKNMKRDIEIIEKRKKAFLIVGFVLLGLFVASIVGLVFLGIGTYNALQNEEWQAAYFLFILFDSLVGSLSVLFLIGFIALFVIRGVLLDKQIEKRRRLIEDYEDLHSADTTASE